MNYKEGTAYLEQFMRFPAKPGLHRIESILTYLGNPHIGITYVHVTGTNGKGSTSAAIASILQAASYRVGLFTSPHLHSYTERIKVNGRDISERDFLRLLLEIKVILDKFSSIQPTIFEILTALTFLYFKEKKVDLTVLEVGLGGLMDATNIIEHSTAVITNVDLDHKEILGPNRTAIAIQKAGIIKANSRVIIGEQNPRLKGLFDDETKKKRAQAIFLDTQKITAINAGLNGQSFTFGKRKNLFTPLLGAHQIQNMSLAVLAVDALKQDGFKIPESAIKKGLKNTRWPLRFERIFRRPTIYADVGHNLHGIKAIIQTVEEYLPYSNRIVVMGCSADKPYRQMAALLGQLAPILILTKARYHGVKPEKLLKFNGHPDKEIHISQTVSEAISLALKKAKSKSVILVLGGLYLAAEAQEVLALRDNQID